MKAAGEIALAAQSSTSFAERGYKGDGSVITKTDQRVEDYLYAQVAGLYPQANILAEETVRSYDPDRPYTFAIDPIDGTDVFSQGMHGWCVSLGLFNQLQPVAGILFAPRLGLLFFADVGKRATVNGAPVLLPDWPDTLSAKSNIMVSSKIHQELDLSRFPGKIRSIGSAALHLCFPLLYEGVFGALQSRGVHIWDIAGAHAINRSVGFDFEYLAGGPLDYSTMTNGGATDDVIVCGSPERISELRGALIG